jgi:hypothetical protein
MGIAHGAGRGRSGAVNLAYLERRGKVTKSGNGRTARWQII